MSIFTDLAAQIYAGAAGRFDFILALFNNTLYAKERLDTHVHDGTDGSVLMRVGGNLLRNGSFEDDAVGTVQPSSWTYTPTSGGGGAVSADNLHASKSYAITATNWAAGGGNLLSNEFIECGAGEVLPWQSFCWGYGSVASATVSIANPAVVAMTNHGLAANHAVVFSTTGALPSNVVPGRVYYVSAIGLTASEFQFSEIMGGAYIISSGTQSGAHTVTRLTSAKIQAVWYNAARAEISSSDLWVTNIVSVGGEQVSGCVTVPIVARYVKIRLIGGIPSAAGSSVGTVWFDGVTLYLSKSKSILFKSPGIYSFVMPEDFVEVDVQGGGAGGQSNGYASSAGSWGKNLPVYAKKGTAVLITVGAGGGINIAGGTSSFGIYHSYAGGTVGTAGLYAPGQDGMYPGTGSPYSQYAIPATYGGSGWHGVKGGDGFVNVRW